MVRKSNWSDKQLEQLLKSMPKVEDHRDPRNIYQNIQLKLNVKNKRSYAIPSIATAAAILLFVVLAPSLMNWNESSDSAVEQNSASDTSSEIKIMKDEEKEMIVEESEENSEPAQTEEEAEVNIAKFDDIDAYTALYEDDVADENVFTFAIPDLQAQNIVPITVVVPREDGKTPIAQFNETMPKLTEEQWGLTDYFPLNAELSVDDSTGTLKVNVPSGHYYGDGSGNETPFTATLKELAKSLNLQKIALFTDNQPGIEFGNFGVLPELDPAEQKNRAYYFYHPNNKTDKPYLVPYQKTYSTIEEALKVMQGSVTTHSLEPSIPESMNIAEILSADDEVLTLQVDENSNLPNEPSMIQTIEAILLTAKDFNYKKVKIEYNKAENIGKFNFNEELNVPLAANKKAF